MVFRFIRSGSGRNHFKILAADQRIPVGAQVAGAPVSDQIGFEGGLAVAVEPGESHLRGSEIFPEELNHILRRKRKSEIAKDGDAAEAFDRRSKTLLHCGFIAPQRWRWHAGR